MLSLNLKISLITLCVVLDIYLYIKTINNKVEFKSFITWIFLSVLLILMTLFDNLLIPIRDFFGFETISNMIFLVGYICLSLMILSLNFKMHEQQNKIIKLTQEVALLKKDKNDEKINK